MLRIIAVSERWWFSVDSRVWCIVLIWHFYIGQFGIIVRSAMPLITLHFTIRGSCQMFGIEIREPEKRRWQWRIKHAHEKLKFRFCCFALVDSWIFELLAARSCCCHSCNSCSHKFCSRFFIFFFVLLLLFLDLVCWLEFAMAWHECERANRTFPDLFFVAQHFVLFSFSLYLVVWCVYVVDSNVPVWNVSV